MTQALDTASTALFERLRGRLEGLLQALPDKPEETADSTLRWALSPCPSAWRRP